MHIRLTKTASLAAYGLSRRVLHAGTILELPFSVACALIAEGRAEPLMPDEVVETSDCPTGSKIH
jgi:hypothetical protein